MALPALFQTLTPAAAAKIEAAFEPASFAFGMRLFREGDPGDCLYLVDAGQVRLQYEREELDGDAVLGFADPGSIVGELAVLDGGRRSASAYAHTNVKARRLSSDAVERLLADDPAAGAALVRSLAAAIAGKLRATTDRLASELFPASDPEVDALVARAVAAQILVAALPDAQVEAALAALAAAVSAAAEELARDTVAETRIGNVADKTLKNRIAADLVYSKSIAGQPGTGVLAHHADRGITELAAPVGVVFGLIPITNPVATAIFKSLACIKGRNALIMNFHRNTRGLAAKVVAMFREVLVAHGLPGDLVQHVERRESRQTTDLLMRHKDVAFILATGGASMVKAAYSSGKPAIGVGPGNCPVLVAADADPVHAAWAIVLSKSFDNGLICGSEHNLVVEESISDALVAALEAQGAAVLSAAEADLLASRIVAPDSFRFRPEIVGQSAATIAKHAGLARPGAIRLLIVPAEKAATGNPWAYEKMAPMLSLFTVPDADAGIALSRQLLEIEGKGHTAIVHTRDAALARRFGMAMPASRILVNSPGAQGIVGYTTNLMPSFTLGCGTFGGNSTTDNVTFRHLLNVKRMAEFVPPPPL